MANNSGTTGRLSTAENWVKGGLASGGVVTALARFGNHDCGSAGTSYGAGRAPSRYLRLAAHGGGAVALLHLHDGDRRYGHLHHVKFWSVLWYLALWVDQNLIMSMYPDVNIFLQIFANPGEHDIKRMLLNMITTSLDPGLPLLWSGMMAWAGVQVGRSINNATAPLARPAQDAGRQGGAIGRLR